jgi:hypothetical protein
MKFPSPQVSRTPIAFFVNEYDSDEFYVEGDAIVFVIRDGSFERKKYCKVPTETFGEVDKVWQTFKTGRSIATLEFQESSLSLLKPELSHIEFRAKNKELTIIQRDIYSGSVIKLNRLVQALGIQTGGAVEEDFGPLGMTTNDFLALFSFDNLIKLHFFPHDKKYFMATGMRHDVEVVVAGCLYDELGIIHHYTQKSEEEEERDG